MFYAYVRPPKPAKVRKKRRKKKFKRRRLPYHLVLNCLRRDSNRPPRLDGSKRRQQKKNVKARYRYRNKLAVSKELSKLFRYPTMAWYCETPDSLGQLSFTPVPRGYPPTRYVVGGQVGYSDNSSSGDVSEPAFSEGVQMAWTYEYLPFTFVYNDEFNNVAGWYPAGIVNRLASSNVLPTMDCTKLYRMMDAYSAKTIRLAVLRLNKVRDTRMYPKIKHTPIKGRRYNSTPLIYDTGASIGLTPFKSDFIDYQPLKGVSVKDIARQNSVLGVGTVMWKFQTRSGRTVYIPAVAYHMDSCDIRLFSPQSYFKQHGGYATMDKDKVAWALPDGQTVDIPLIPCTNLPAVLEPQTTFEEQAEIGPHLMSAFIANVLEVPWEPGNEITAPEYLSHGKFCTESCCSCVADETNQNLTGPQKELLHWHWKLCINMRHVQELMRPRQYVLPDDREIVLPPIIPTHYASTCSCQIPRCLACDLSIQRTTSPKTKTTSPVKSKEGVLKTDKYEPGDTIFSDQFVVHTPGRKLTGYGREGPDQSLNGGTLFVDAASGLLFVDCQVGMGADDTVLSKEKFEQWIWNLAGVCAEHYHSDNGVYNAEAFRNDCIKKDQKQTFSGVGAKHQNAVAERNIQTICYWARTMMVHAAIHWPSDGADNIRLWAFAIQHAVWLYNHIPNRATGLSPLEIFTKTKSDHRDLLRTHVWGCPVFVLDPRLQDGKKIPKFNRRSRMGQFLGFSTQHSTLVGNVRHLQTNYVSPQYHLVYDDLFQTIMNDTRVSDTECAAVFDELFENARDMYAEPTTERSENGAIIYEPPLLDDMWLTEDERREKRVELRKRRERERSRWLKEFEEPIVEPTDTPMGIPHDTIDRDDIGIVSDDDESSAGDSMSEDSDVDFGNGGHGGVDIPSEGVGHAPATEPTTEPPTVPTTGPRRSQRIRKPSGPLRGLERHPEFGNCVFEPFPTPIKRTANKIQFGCTFGTQQPPSIMSSNMSDDQRRAQARRSKLRGRLLAQRLEDTTRMFHANLCWDEGSSVCSLLSSPLAEFVQLAADECDVSSSPILRAVSPYILAARSAASKEDNPTWWQAMNGPHAEEYWKAAEVEIQTLETIKAWVVVERTSDMNVLPSTWAFKCKRYPDGSIKKFKGRFCARGDKQIEGVDFFETYCPVVQWTTVRLMLMLECMLGLVSKQGDVTCAFLHAHLPENEKVYIEMPRGFKQYDKNGKPKVLMLKRTLYGLRQSPRAFWQYLTEKLEKAGLKQSKLDPCLFIGLKVICICYVDDLLFWSPKEEYIYEVGQNLRDQGVELEEEGDAAGFLGVDLSRDPETGQIHMTQVGLIKRIVDALGLDPTVAKERATPAERKPLVKDEDGEPPQESYNYASVVGMLLYLAGHTRPDLAYSVSQVARFMFCPKRSHEQALKMIGRYLIGTMDRGLILTPKKTLDIEAFPDADFAGLYGYEDIYDPVCVRSRTGFIIFAAGIPILWKSSLQTETATSTMEAEIIALSSCCRELFPIMALVEEIAGSIGMKQEGSPKMHVTIHEDNSGALILANTLPPQFTPRSKHYAIKTIWFREKIVEHGINVVAIDTKLQRGDILTKMPPREVFQFLRKLIQGW